MRIYWTYIIWILLLGTFVWRFNMICNEFLLTSSIVKDLTHPPIFISSPSSLTLWASYSFNILLFSNGMFLASSNCCEMLMHSVNCFCSFLSSNADLLRSLNVVSILWRLTCVNTSACSFSSSTPKPTRPVLRRLNIYRPRIKINISITFSNFNGQWLNEACICFS